MPSDVFLSYKTGHDSETANKLRLALKTRGISVWWDQELQCGQQWQSTIDEALVQSAAVIVLWSSESVESNWVKHEASIALAMNKLLPVRISECQLPELFQPIQFVDFAEWTGDEQTAEISRLVATIRRRKLYDQLRSRKWWVALSVALLAVCMGLAFVAQTFSERHSALLEENSQLTVENVRLVSAFEDRVASFDLGIDDFFRACNPQSEEDWVFVATTWRQYSIAKEKLGQFQVAVTICDLDSPNALNTVSALGQDAVDELAAITKNDSRLPGHAVGVIELDRITGICTQIALLEKLAVQASETAAGEQPAQDFFFACGRAAGALELITLDVQNDVGRVRVLLARTDRMIELYGNTSIAALAKLADGHRLVRDALRGVLKRSGAAVDTTSDQ